MTQSKSVRTILELSPFDEGFGGPFKGVNKGGRPFFDCFLNIFKALCFLVVFMCLMLFRLVSVRWGGAAPPQTPLRLGPEPLPEGWVVYLALSKAFKTF